MSDIRIPQNPGIGGLNELTTAEETFIQNIVGLSYQNGDILYYNSGNLQRLPIGSTTEVLTVVAGLPNWEPASGGGATILDDLADVTLTSPQEDDFLVKSAGDWVNLSPGLINITNFNNNAGFITSVSGQNHGSLSGLLNDSHTQYAYLAGRSGGQILSGGTGTVDDFTIQPTSGAGTTGANVFIKSGSNGAIENASFNSGAIVFNDGSVDMDFRIESDGDANNFFSDGGTNRIGIGIGVPTAKLHIVNTVASDIGLRLIDPTSASNYSFLVQNAAGTQNWLQHSTQGGTASVLAVVSSASKYFQMESYAADNNYFSAAGAPFSIRTIGAYPIIFYTNTSTGRMHLTDFNGHLIVGTSANATNGDARIHSIWDSGPQLRLGQDVSNTAYMDATVASTTGITTFNAVGTTPAFVFSDDVSVPDEAYDATNWNGSLEVPTKNAVRDKIETLQTLDATLTALAAYNTNGLLTQTAADTFTGRTITGTTNQVVVTNGNGVSGNPTLALPQSIATSSTPQFASLGIGGAAAASTGLLVSGTGYTSNLIAATGSISPTAGTNATLYRIAGTIVEAASGTHNLMAAMFVGVTTITTGAATANNTASLFVEGPMAATVTGGNWAVWVDAGVSRFTDTIKIGGTAVRGTTEGTAQLVLYNGTAPVGTLTNGVSFYAASGEARVMDAAGNSTLLSPHDHETNEWVFYSKNTKTGKVLQINMEQMMKFLNKHFETDFVQEYIEDPEVDGRTEYIEQLYSNDIK